MTEDDKPPSDNAAGALLLAAINLDEIPEPTIASVDHRIHVQASKDLTACGRTIGAVQVADIGQTVNCVECAAWLDEDDEETPARGTSIPVNLELTLETTPAVQMTLQVTLPDGKAHRVSIPQLMIDTVRGILADPQRGPHRVTWRWPSETVDVGPQQSQG